MIKAKTEPLALFLSHCGERGIIWWLRHQILPAPLGSASKLTLLSLSSAVRTLRVLIPSSSQ